MHRESQTAEDPVRCPQGCLGEGGEYPAPPAGIVRTSTPAEPRPRRNCIGPWRGAFSGPCPRPAARAPVPSRQPVPARPVRPGNRGRREDVPRIGRRRVLPARNCAMNSRGPEEDRSKTTVEFASRQRCQSRAVGMVRSHRAGAMLTVRRLSHEGCWGMRIAGQTGLNA